jgi:MtfA peptidase
MGPLVHSAMIFFDTFRRNRLKEEPFPDEWMEILKANVKLYQHLPPELQNELLDSIKIFLAEKEFFGCEGRDITDEIRVTIAAQACILILNRDTDYYPDLDTIVVYPNAFVATQLEVDDYGIVTEETHTLLGESWQSGTIVLSWNSALKGGQHIKDGSNLVFHEFAHQLDTEDDHADGTPKLERYRHYRPWIDVMTENYKELLKKVARGKKTLLGSYASTEPAEFFAVATEFFFEKPHKLKKKHSDLYDALKDYYNQDPVSYHKKP